MGTQVGYRSEGKIKDATCGRAEPLEAKAFSQVAEVGRRSQTTCAAGRDDLRVHDDFLVYISTDAGVGAVDSILARLTRKGNRLFVAVCCPGLQQAPACRKGSSAACRARAAGEGSLHRFRRAQTAPEKAKARAHELPAALAKLLRDGLRLPVFVTGASLAL